MSDCKGNQQRASCGIEGRWYAVQALKNHLRNGWDKINPSVEREHQNTYVLFLLAEHGVLRMSEEPHVVQDTLADLHTIRALNTCHCSKTMTKVVNSVLEDRATSLCSSSNVCNRSFLNS
jgi:hypothetical protein